MRRISPMACSYVPLTASQERDAVYTGVFVVGPRAAGRRLATCTSANRVGVQRIRRGGKTALAVSSPPTSEMATSNIKNAVSTPSSVLWLTNASSAR
jgi:hypothetical protein